MKRVLLLLLLVGMAGPACTTEADPQQPSGRSESIESRLEIAALINEWTFYRDQESWDALLDTFHEDGRISLSWFDGPYGAFVKASRELAKRGGTIVKHHVGTPRITVNGSRAISEVNATIMVRVATQGGEVDTTSYARFYDQIEKRDGTWRILKRTAIYEKDRVDPVQQPALPEEFLRDLGQYPPELRFLASSLEKVGAELSKAAIRDRSPELAGLYEQGQAWLAASTSVSPGAGGNL